MEGRTTLRLALQGRLLNYNTVLHYMSIILKIINKQKCDWIIITGQTVSDIRQYFYFQTTLVSYLMLNQTNAVQFHRLIGC